MEFVEPETAEEEVPKKKKSKTINGAAKANTKEILRVSTTPTLNMGPYPQDIPKKNTIRFTPAQCKNATFLGIVISQFILMHHIWSAEAIHSGMNPGLTMIVGPPGTGKTDVAVQIIANLYHNFPNQHTLLITHSNQALNQLFEKIMALGMLEKTNPFFDFGPLKITNFYIL